MGGTPEGIARLAAMPPLVRFRSVGNNGLPAFDHSGIFDAALDPFPASRPVFGLFRLVGYRFSPRLADIGGTQFWRIDAQADHGELNALARQRVNLQRITAHWDDCLRGTRRGADNDGPA